MQAFFRFDHQYPKQIPRGELWLGKALFDQAGLDTDLDGHLKLRDRLGHHLVSLSLSEDSAENLSMGYRYFSPTELKRAGLKKDDRIVAVMDGPFQSLADRMGLYGLLRDFRQRRSDIEKAYAIQAAKVIQLLYHALELPIDAVVIADDLAAERSLLVSPNDIQALFSPFYTEVVSNIHSADVVALFHSCGTITDVTTNLLSWGFDGFAAIENRLNPLIDLRKKYGEHLLLMGGIDPELLQSPQISTQRLAEFQFLVQSLHASRGHVICSSSGLYSPELLPRLDELYRVADQISEKY